MTTAKRLGATRLGNAGAVGMVVFLLGHSSELVGVLLSGAVVLIMALMAVLALTGAFARRKARRDAASLVLKQLLDFLRPPSQPG